MTESDWTLMMEILKDVQARMSGVEKGITRIHVEIAALGQQVAGLGLSDHDG